MVFYNNRVSIADVDGTEIYLIKEYKNKLILNYYSSVGDIVESVLVEDSVGDFDISIYDDTIYLVYQDLKYYLNILILKGNEKSIHKISSDSLPKLFELNIIKHNDRISIFYLYPIDISQKIFQIKHNMLKDNKWHNFQVDEARVSQVLNPIKIIHDGEDIFLAYYLFFLFKQPVILNQIDMFTKGTVYKLIQKSDFEKIRIPRIGSELEEQIGERILSYLTLLRIT